VGTATLGIGCGFGRASSTSSRRAANWRCSVVIRPSHASRLMWREQSGAVLCGFSRLKKFDIIAAFLLAKNASIGVLVPFRPTLAKDERGIVRTLTQVRGERIRFHSFTYTFVILLHLSNGITFESLSMSISLHPNNARLELSLGFGSVKLNAAYS